MGNRVRVRSVGEGGGGCSLHNVCVWTNFYFIHSRWFLCVIVQVFIRFERCWSSHGPYFGETVGRAKIPVTIFENKNLSTWETSCVTHGCICISFPLLGDRSPLKDAFGREYVVNACVASFSMLLIFYEAIQWFNVGGNFTFAADKPNCLWFRLKS